MRRIPCASSWHNKLPIGVPVSTRQLYKFPLTYLVRSPRPSHGSRNLYIEDLSICFELLKITLEREKKYLRDNWHQNDLKYKNNWLGHNYLLKQDFITVISLCFIFIPVSQRNSIRIVNIQLSSVEDQMDLKEKTISKIIPRFLLWTRNQAVIYRGERGVNLEDDHL